METKIRKSMDLLTPDEEKKKQIYRKLTTPPAPKSHRKLLALVACLCIILAANWEQAATYAKDCVTFVIRWLVNGEELQTELAALPDVVIPQDLCESVEHVWKDSTATSLDSHEVEKPYLTKQYYAFSELEELGIPLLSSKFYPEHVEIGLDYLDGNEGKPLLLYQNVPWNDREILVLMEIQTELGETDVLNIGFGTETEDGLDVYRNDLLEAFLVKSDAPVYGDVKRTITIYEPYCQKEDEWYRLSFYTEKTNDVSAYWTYGNVIYRLYGLKDFDEAQEWIDSFRLPYG